MTDSSPIRHREPDFSTIPSSSSPRLYSVPDACRVLGGMGRTWLYGQIKAGRIRTIKLGARTMVPATEIDRVIAEAGEAA